LPGDLQLVRPFGKNSIELAPEGREEVQPLNDLTKNILLWVVIVLVLLAVFSRYMPTVTQAEDVSYSAFLGTSRIAASWGRAVC